MNNELKINEYYSDDYYSEDKRELFIEVSVFGAAARAVEWDKPIYHFMPYNDFKQYWLIPKKMCMSLPTLWPDPVDALLYRPFNIKSDEGTIKVTMGDEYKKNYVMCWSRENESELLWGAYGKSIQSVCLVSTLRKIMNNLYDFTILHSNYFFRFCVKNILYLSKKRYINYINNIKRYINYVNNITNKDEREKRFVYSVPFINLFLCIDSLFKKIETHKDEREIRFVFSVPSNDEKGSDFIDQETLKNEWNGEDNFFCFPMDINRVISEIRIHPSLDEETTEKIKKEIKDSGFDNDVKRSELYTNFMDSVNSLASHKKIKGK